MVNETCLAKKEDAHGKRMYAAYESGALSVDRPTHTLTHNEQFSNCQKCCQRYQNFVINQETTHSKQHNVCNSNYVGIVNIHIRKTVLHFSQQPIVYSAANNPSGPVGSPLRERWTPPLSPATLVRMKLIGKLMRWMDGFRSEVDRFGQKTMQDRNHHAKVDKTGREQRKKSVCWHLEPKEKEN